MTEKNGAFIFTFTAKTDIWTGDADGQPNSLKHTGLLGSIRWWFEVVVRGLGGYACDPSETKCKDKNHCVVCELFGCTGWARKFRFDVLDECCIHIQEQIKADDKFKLKFTPLRPIQGEEWALLSLTLKLIARYGAIGGKTVYKPSNGIHKDKVHHKDFGLVKLQKQPYFKKETIEGITELRSYVIASQWIKNNNEKFWASLENFWCVRNNFLEFSSFNTVLKEFEWLAGKQQESKRIFSFKNPARTFGFVNSSINLTHEAMRKELRNKAWNCLTDEEYIDGVDNILKSLIQQLRKSKM
jgi:CRISPR-associated protein Cmr1